MYFIFFICEFYFLEWWLSDVFILFFICHWVLCVLKNFISCCIYHLYKHYYLHESAHKNYFPAIITTIFRFTIVQLLRFFFNISLIHHNEILLLLLYSSKLHITSLIIRIRGNALFAIILSCIIGFTKSEPYYLDVSRYLGGPDTVAHTSSIDSQGFPPERQYHQKE